MAGIGASIVVLREPDVVPDMLRAGGMAMIAESSFSVVVPRAETMRSVCAGAGEGAGAGAVVFVTVFGLDVITSATIRLGVGDGLGATDFALGFDFDPLVVSATERVGVGEGAGAEDFAVAFFPGELSAVTFAGAGEASGAAALAVAFVFTDGVASGVAALATAELFFVEGAGADGVSISRGFGWFDRNPILGAGAGAGVGAGLAATLVGIRVCNQSARFSASDKAPPEPPGAASWANEVTTAMKATDPRMGRKKCNLPEREDVFFKSGAAYNLFSSRVKPFRPGDRGGCHASAFRLRAPGASILRQSFKARMGDPIPTCTTGEALPPRPE